MIGGKELGTTANRLAANKNLWNSRYPQPAGQDLTNIPTLVLFLISDGVKINAKVVNVQRIKEFTNRPTELAPLKCEHDDWMRSNGFIHEANGIHIQRYGWQLPPFFGCATACGVSNRHPGVDCDNKVSSSFISSEIPSNNGVDM